MKRKVWKSVTECPECKSHDLKWYLKSTKECKDCTKVFHAEDIVEEEYPDGSEFCFWCDNQILEGELFDVLPEDRGKAHDKCAEEFYAVKCIE